ncbi:DUF5018 domain-containing protein [Ichthyobacterium seriolicida]|uniref:Pkd domain containing protein n=1 Tax=Ichthyobacterium seriolicida TaxID=242600 RepID=A0A1J1E9A7_9FLAO|nr:hypothetical protein [Ichthyobacterium seriolicida]BAV94112.1 pkd domain containing protein [Ichthyobacterium seriolicida]
MFKKNYFVKSIIFSFVLLSAIIFSCEKNKVYQDDLGVCIESFSLLDSENKEKKLGSDIKCEIDTENYTISLTVPSSAVLTGLKFNITPCEGTTISPASGEEVDFEEVQESTEKKTTTDEVSEESTKKPSPQQRYKKVFTLTKGDKSQDYIVYITKALASDCYISSFKLEKSKNKNKIFADRNSDIVESTNTEPSTITLHVSDAATLDNLNPTIVHTGASITSGELVSTTENSITTTAVNYTVTTDGKTKVYAVKYIKDLSSNNRISEFKFNKDDSSSLNTGLKLTRSSAGARAVDVTINDANGTIVVKASTQANIDALIPTITKHERAAISPDVASHDYSNSKVYTVTAQDGQTKQYTVSVSKNLSNAKEISSFTFKHSVNSGKNFGNTDYSAENMPSATGDDDVNVSIAKIPHTVTDLTGLKPTIAISASATANPADGEAQNFTRGTAKRYVVTAQDGTTKNYDITIPVLQAVAEITSFKIKPSDHSGNSKITSEIEWTKSDDENYIIVLDGEDNSTVSLSPEIILSAGATTVNPASKASTTFTYGQVQNYVVTAEDGSTTKTYQVTVKSSNSKMKSFGFKNDGANSGKKIVKDVSGVINHSAKTVTVKVPYNTDVTALTPEVLGNNGSTVTINGQAATTAQDFSSEKTYTVTAQDGTTSDYTVTVSKEDAPQLTEFKITADESKGIKDEVTATFDHPTSDGKGGKIKLKFDHKVASRNDEIVLTGLSYTSDPVDGHTLTPNTPLGDSESIEGKKITLTTTLGSTSEYTVTAVKGPFIKSFKFGKDTSGNSDKNLGSADVDGIINHAAGTITLEVPSGVTMGSDGNTVTLTPTIEVGGDTAAVDPTSATAQTFTPDGSTAIQYTVTNSTDTSFTKTYTVTVTKKAASAK